MTRHRPTYLLWTSRGYVAVCGCHYGLPVRFDRPLPKCTPTLSERAA